MSIKMWTGEINDVHEIGLPLINNRVDGISDNIKYHVRRHRTGIINFQFTHYVTGFVIDLQRISLSKRHVCFACVATITGIKLV